MHDKGIDIRSEKFGQIPAWRPYRLVQHAAEANDRVYDLSVAFLPSFGAPRADSRLLQHYLHFQSAAGPPPDALRTLGLPRRRFQGSSRPRTDRRPHPVSPRVSPSPHNRRHLSPSTFFGSNYARTSADDRMRVQERYWDRNGAAIRVSAHSNYFSRRLDRTSFASAYPDLYG